MKAALSVALLPVELLVCIVLLVAVPRDEWSKLNDSI